MEELDQEFIRDYYNQKLDDDQRLEFERRYREDAEFKAMADEIELDVVAIRESGREQLKQKFTSWDQQAGNETTELKQVQFSAWRIGIAASLFLAAGLYFYFMAPKSGDELYATYYEPYQNFEYTAVRDEVPDSLLLKYRAFANYDTGNYKEALVHFDKMVELDPDNVPIRFFRAMCLFERIEYEQALKEFQQVAASDHVYYADAAIWYAALIHLRHEKYDKVRVFLNDLSSRTGDYQQRAKQLNRELKD